MCRKYTVASLFLGYFLMAFLCLFEVWSVVVGLVSLFGTNKVSVVLIERLVGFLWLSGNICKTNTMWKRSGTAARSSTAQTQNTRWRLQTHLPMMHQRRSSIINTSAAVRRLSSASSRFQTLAHKLSSSYSWSHLMWQDIKKMLYFTVCSDVALLYLRRQLGW